MGCNQIKSKKNLNENAANPKLRLVLICYKDNKLNENETKNW